MKRHEIEIGARLFYRSGAAKSARPVIVIGMDEMIHEIHECWSCGHKTESTRGSCIRLRFVDDQTEIVVKTPKYLYANEGDAYNRPWSWSDARRVQSEVWSQ